MSDKQKPGDPADKVADKAADGAFGGVQSHRAGYGDDKLQRLTDWLRAHPTATLASGEGALLLGEIDRMHEVVLYGSDRYTEARNEIDRLRRILATLREPSAAVTRVVRREWHLDTTPDDLVRFAVAVAEQEVGG